MNDYILEVCVDSAESALAAAKGGASRLELCQNLVIGGTTPGSKLFEVIRRQTTIPIHALIRPRFGDFCYTPYELEEIREEVAMYHELGAEGVVIGRIYDGTEKKTALFQDFQVYPVTVREYLLMGNDSNLSNARVSEVLDMLECSNLKQGLVHNRSVLSRLL